MSLAALSGVSLLPAAPAAIGIATSDDAILLDNAKTAGNATIFEGSTLETQSAISQVEMKGGARVRFAENSRGRLFCDHVDLEKGSVRFWGFSATANGLTVRGEGMATVSLQGQVVEIAALEGNVHVFSASGTNVANLLPGRVLNLRTGDAGAGSLSEMEGCVTESGGAFRLRDDVTGLTVQLHGVTARAGQRFRVTGTLVSDAGGSAAALRITAAKELAGTCGSGAASAVAGAVAAAGIGTTVVVAGAGAAGTAVAVIATEGSSSASRAESQSEADCTMRRGRACRSPSPTGSGSQPGQLSGGK